MINQENDSQPDGALFTDSYTGAMQFTPGTYFTLNGEWHKVISAEESPEPEAGRFRVQIKREKPPQGTPSMVSFFTADEGK